MEVTDRVLPLSLIVVPSAPSPESGRGFGVGFGGNVSFGGHVGFGGDVCLCHFGFGSGLRHLHHKKKTSHRTHYFNETAREV